MDPEQNNIKTLLNFYKSFENQTKLLYTLFEIVR